MTRMKPGIYEPTNKWRLFESRKFASTNKGTFTVGYKRIYQS
jgi:hypothetical protein